MAALDAEVRRDLRGLQKDTADSVARHLVAAGSLMEEDPALALEHARYARRRASRIAVVREAAGIAAYHAEEWTEALAELRAARRMGGGPIHLPVMADIERALGRPERAIDIARSPEAAELGTAGRIELAIVGAGARRDLGELDAAVVGLQIAELDPARRDPWSARLFYAYADNLLAAGRESDALQWFVHASDADVEGETDAFGRIAELTGQDPDDADDFAFGMEEVDHVDDTAVRDEAPVTDRPGPDPSVADETGTGLPDVGTSVSDDEVDPPGDDVEVRGAAVPGTDTAPSAGVEPVEMSADAGTGDAGSADAGPTDSDPDDGATAPVTPETGGAEEPAGDPTEEDLR